MPDKTPAPDAAVGSEDDTTLASVRDRSHRQPVSVIQADRDASWPFAPAYIRWDPNGSERQRQKWMAGDYDSKPIVQAFARHRLAALAPAGGDYVLVPREPSDAEIAAGVEFALNGIRPIGFDVKDYVRGLRAAMLAAAPPPPTSEPAVQGTFSCPICGKDTPHYHSPDEQRQWQEQEAWVEESWQKFKGQVFPSEPAADVDGRGGEPQTDWHDRIVEVAKVGRYEEDEGVLAIMRAAYVLGRVEALSTSTAAGEAPEPDFRGRHHPDVEKAAKGLYDTMKHLPGWVPWVEHGNSLKQEEARQAARAALAKGDDAR